MSDGKTHAAKATVAGRTIADSDKCLMVENNYYFPPDSVDQAALSKSDTTTFCPWKGTASYYNINLDKTELKDAAWYYSSPKDKAVDIKNYVAFYKTMVTVVPK